MRVLTYESKDKQQQTIEELSYEEVLLGLQEDKGWVEVIDAYDQNTFVRAFFDIDSYKEIQEPLIPILEELNRLFTCTSDDWAISDGSRSGKISYHVVSKRFSLTIKKLRQITYVLHEQFPIVDYSLLCISPMVNHDLLFFRLPNQSKHAIRKPGTPMRIVQGELGDFCVTHIDGLAQF